MVGERLVGYVVVGKVGGGGGAECVGSPLRGGAFECCAAVLWGGRPAFKGCFKVVQILFNRVDGVDQRPDADHGAKLPAVEHQPAARGAHHVARRG